MRRLSRLAARPMAAIAASSVSATKPVTPSSMTSGTAPRRKATTGVPQAMASIMTRPNGSGQSIGKSNAAAFFSRSVLASSLTSPTSRMWSPSISGLEPILVVARFRPRDLGCHVQRDFGDLGQADSNLRTFVSRQSTKKREIATGAITRLQELAGHAVVDRRQPVCLRTGWRWWFEMETNGARGKRLISSGKSGVSKRLCRGGGVRHARPRQERQMQPIDVAVDHVKLGDRLDQTIELERVGDHCFPVGTA